MGTDRADQLERAISAHSVDVRNQANQHVYGELARDVTEQVFLRLATLQSLPEGPRLRRLLDKLTRLVVYENLLLSGRSRYPRTDYDEPLPGLRRDDAYEYEPDAVRELLRAFEQREREHRLRPKHDLPVDVEDWQRLLDGINTSRAYESLSTTERRLVRLLLRGYTRSQVRRNIDSSLTNSEIGARLRTWLDRSRPALEAAREPSPSAFGLDKERLRLMGFGRTVDPVDLSSRIAPSLSPAQRQAVEDVIAAETQARSGVTASRDDESFLERVRAAVRSTR